MYSSAARAYRKDRGSTWPIRDALSALYCPYGETGRRAQGDENESTKLIWNPQGCDRGTNSSVAELARARVNNHEWRRRGWTPQALPVHAGHWF